MGELEWGAVKEAVVAKMKDFDAKTLTNILVLATVSRGSDKGKSMSTDLFEQVEPEVIIKMKTMTLPDLLNLMWSA